MPDPLPQDTVDRLAEAARRDPFFIRTIVCDSDKGNLAEWQKAVWHMHMAIGGIDEAPLRAALDLWPDKRPVVRAIYDEWNIIHYILAQEKKQHRNDTFSRGPRLLVQPEESWNLDLLATLRRSELRRKAGQRSATTRDREVYRRMAVQSWRSRRGLIKPPPSKFDLANVRAGDAKVPSA